MDTAGILANVEGLLPEVAARADEVAAQRRLPGDLVASLKAAGAFRLPMPAAWGGPEMSLPDQVRVVERLSAADPSTGWCVMIGSDGGFYSAYLTERAGRTLWPDLDMVTAGWVFPAGQARRVDGGFVMSGRWSFGSGCTHADVLIGGCLVVGEDGTPEMDGGLPRMRVLVAPAEHFEVLDTWYTTGLAGSGSNDYSCSELFVPEEHSFSFAEEPRRDGPLYRYKGAFFANIYGVPLGLARRAIDEVVGVASTKVLMPQFVTMRDLPRVQSAVADAETALRSARSYTYDAVEALWDALVSQQEITPQIRIDVTLSRIAAFRMAREVAMQMVALAGTQAIYATSVLDRLLRDAITINQHVVAGPVMQEFAGQLALGLDPQGPLAMLV